VSVLPDLVRDRIAAGEVVERPASVVKELVENSLDAGATRIDVDIEQGGRRRIRVSDDGCGMSPEDLARAVQRFATSKIRSEKDLSGVTTLGFRGEALPSVASVAELEITTREGGAESGSRLVLEPGSGPRAPVDAPSAPGTVVEVRNLFARTPARLKFLRADSTETAAVAEAVERLALARPGVAFRLRSNGKDIFAAPAGQSLRERAVAALGDEAARGMLEVDSGEEGWLAVRGLASAPDGVTRRNGKWGFLALNGRPIRDRTLAHAARSAYESVIPQGRFPIYVLAVDIAPGEVDVNVHPAKFEVRFRRPRDVHDFVRRAVREALRGSGVELGAGPAPSFSGGGGGGPVRGAPASSSGRAYDLWGPSVPEGTRGASVVGEAGAGAVVPAAVSIAGGPDGFRVLGTMRSGYVIVETPDDLRIVDPHAVHERALYERLSGAEEGTRPASQQLLVPEVAELSASEAAAFERAQGALDGLGFVAEHFGERTVAVRAVPEGVPPSAAGEILREVLADLEGGGSGARAETLDRARKSLACRAAVKLGSRLDESEIAHLLAGAEAAPTTCPHGRPVWWSVPHGEIARRLGR
jgi:DNA mismatch repair protein MutL